MGKLFRKQWRVNRSSFVLQMIAFHFLKYLVVIRVGESKGVGEGVG